MEPPLKSRFPGLACHLLQFARSGGPLFAPNRSAPLIVNRQSRRNGDNLLGLCAKSHCAPNGDRVRVTPCSRASRRRVRFGAALSYRVRVWPFSAIRG